MKLLLDECVDARIAGPLRALGHDVLLVHERDPSASDREVLALARADTRVLITSDLDFGELLVRSGLRAPGVVVLRLEGEPPHSLAARVDTAIRTSATELASHLLVIDRRRNRLRRLPAPPAAQ